MRSRHHPLYRRRGLNDVQLLRLSEILGDLAQVLVAAFSIPLFFGQISVFWAFSSLCLAFLLWYVGIALLRS